MDGVSPSNGEECSSKASESGESAARCCSGINLSLAKASTSKSNMSNLSSVAPSPPPQRSDSIGTRKAHRATVMLMKKIKQAKEEQAELLFGASTPTEEKKKAGISFAHIMYILKQQRKNREYLNLIAFCFFVMLYIFILTSNRAAFATNGLNRGISKVLIEEAFNEPEPGALFEDTRTYFDTVDFQEMWGWMQGPMLNVLWSEETYFGAPHGRYIHGTNSTRRVILGQTHMLGKVMIRQLRSEPSLIQSYDKGETFKTYPYVEDDWAPTNEPKNGTISPRFGTYFGDHSLSNLNGVTTGFFTYINYGRNAWVIHLPREQDKAAAEMERLKKAGMADEGTAIISVDFSTINPSINSISSVRIIFEMTSTGFLRHKAWIWTVPVKFYSTTSDIIRGLGEVLFVIFLVVYTIGELRELRLSGFKIYFNSMFNRVEVLNLFLFWYNVGAYSYFMYTWYFHLDFNDDELDLYGWTMYYNSNTRTAAFNTLICFFKVFKYLQVSPRFNLMWATIGYASKDLISFLFVWLLFMFGYCTVGMLTYGPDLEDWVTYVNAFITLFKILLGDFHYSEMEASSPIMTPIFFVTFVVLVFFITVNMMVAIILKGFDRAKQNAADQAHRLKPVPFVYNGFMEFFIGLGFILKSRLGWISIPVEAMTHHHAVHLLADPKMRQDMEDGAILTLNGDEQAAADFDPTKVRKMAGASAKEIQVRNLRRKATKLKVEKARKSHAQAKLEVWRQHLVAARRLKKVFAESKSIQRAYVRLEKLENKIPRTVYEKVLEISEMATILGSEEAARQAIIDFTFLQAGAHHMEESIDEDDHSDSAHIVETNDATKVMKNQLTQLIIEVRNIGKKVNSLTAANQPNPSKI